MEETYEEKYKRKNRENTHRCTMKKKEQFFEHYGAECAICHEKNKDVLTIDHINDNGAEHRKKVGDNTYCVIKDLERRGWPENEVQTLCYNCNNKKKMQKQTLNGQSYSSLIRELAVIKLGGKCSCCGVEDKQMLELRPKNGKIKDYQAKYGRVELLKLIITGKLTNEFEVLCVNCHRLKQYKESN